MNKISKSLLVLFSAFLFGSCFGFYFVQAQNNNLILEVSKECHIQYTGDSCIAELKLTNNTGKVLDGEAFLHIDYQGVCSNKLRNFDGEGIKAQFSIANSGWLNFSDDWEKGTTTVSGFSIPKSETQPKLKIKTVPNLCPGEYTFTLMLKGITEKGEEIVTPLLVIGGGGGGVFTAKITISDESAAFVKTDTVTISWQTNDPATSRVIYDTISHLTLGDPLNYGYTFSTPEQDKDPKVTFHSIRIDGLIPGTTYFYRIVSRASPEKISQEHSFTTLTLAEGEKEKEAGEEEKEKFFEEGKPVPEEGIEEEEKKEKEEVTTGEETKESEEGKEAPAEESVPQKGLVSMVAGIGMTLEEISKSTFLIIIVILCLIGLVLIGAKEWKLFRKKRKK